MKRTITLRTIYGEQLLDLLADMDISATKTARSIDEYVHLDAITMEQLEEVFVEMNDRRYNFVIVAIGENYIS